MFPPGYMCLRLIIKPDNASPIEKAALASHYNISNIIDLRSKLVCLIDPILVSIPDSLTDLNMPLNLRITLLLSSRSTLIYLAILSPSPAHPSSVVSYGDYLGVK